MEYETCNHHACHETKRTTPWTPWLLANETEAGTRIERRFRFSCKAPVDIGALKSGPMKHEERICHADGTCLRTDSSSSSTEGGWFDWSDWTECSRPCGGGRQLKRRTCDGRPSDCDGSALMERACNLQPCKGTWNCWSEWTPCSASCGQGTRSRSRSCMIEGGGGGGGGDGDSSEASNQLLPIDGCSGPSETKELCNNAVSCQPTEGWHPWSEWSVCDADALQYRARKCSTDSPGPGLCQGRSREERLCLDNVEGNV